MMSMSPGALNAASAERYFREHYSQDDYYTQGQTCIGRWVGKGAAGLGLSGDVAGEDFSALLQGIHPHSGAVLVPAAAHNGHHAAGWDSVYSAPKSVSIQALVGEDHRLITAHERAVERTLREIEAFAIAHQKGNRERVVSANIVGAAFNHLAARPVGDSNYGPDPQLHTHVVLLNVTKRPDNAWRGLDPLEIYRAQSFGSAVYRSELAREVQKLGYGIQVTAANGAWELEGYSREQVMAFSQRRQEILQAMTAAGLSGAKAAEIVALNTRLAKGTYDQAELKTEWQERAAFFGIDAKLHLNQTLARGAVQPHSAAEALEATAYAAQHTTEREAVVDRRTLEAAALQHGMGRADLDTLRDAIKTDERQHLLIRAGKPDWSQPQGAFTTNEMLALERDNLALVCGGLNHAQPVAEAATVTSWTSSKTLSSDQIAAAQLTLTSGNWVTAIEGLAGTAKTTTVGAVREFAEAQNYTVRGFGMTSGSVKALKEAGLEASTIASLTANKMPAKTGPEVWIVDESSLLATRSVNQLLHAAQSQQVERIVFVGDQRQHHAIEAGAPLRQFLADNLAVAELNIIRRQKDAQLKEAVELAARGHTGDALDKLYEQNRLHEIPDVSERYRRIADNFLCGSRAGETTLVVSPGNDERRELNQTIRNHLIAHGQVAAEQDAHSILVARDLTRAQKQYARNYREGDVVYFPTADKRQGIARGSYLSVESVNGKANLLAVRGPSGEQCELTPARWDASQVYQPEDRALARGERIQFRIHDKHHHIANGEFATITALKDRAATLKFDGGRELNLPLEQLRHIDYGYCSTSHASQGATVQSRHGQRRFHAFAQAGQPTAILRFHQPCAARRPSLHQ